MLDRLYFVPDIVDRYHCGSADTARRYMRQMGATGTPLFVTEDMIREWELSKRKPIPSRTTVGMKIPRRR